MQDEYVNIFYELVKEAIKSSGCELPYEVEAYIAILLGTHLAKPSFLPQTSFAETYLELQKRNFRSAKELADTCLFVTGVFPNFGSNKGLDIEYYSSIGKSSYISASNGLNKDLFSIISARFDFLREIIEITTTPSPLTIKIIEPNKRETNE
ncbi:MAG: hypothetical protein H8D23_10700 [Candidatus Brocadiales bacterium]|nr:hypothetical protein [Candidatus Brocadiales bacterium]